MHKNIYFVILFYKIQKRANKAVMLSTAFLDGRNIKEGKKRNTAKVRKELHLRKGSEL